ncbi:adenosylcobinamide-phosphate synthase [Halopseudomonas sabulinigri]|uniref:Cobalamin biosynthesis protein CobD n=1 Tax=Halopseudomonas sabulinigri TaxID=472181 RepID=A0A1H1NE72_9GAMM|nr:adenosylcobinamide-phosphate synthase CbiB [Halopseudomonas sabulinigri]SDR97214.1 adenosylcobinamide-phosphate synthase [Halopseudomonas sabulinigri]
MTGLLPAALLAALLDRLLGEPSRWHPLVGFGRWAQYLEQRLNRHNSILRGALAWALAVLPFTVLAYWLASWPVLGWVFAVLCLYVCLGGQSLTAHARPIAEALQRKDLPLARELVGRIVSRDTRQLSEEGIARATVESVLENGSDALFAALFWFLLLGAPGVVLYRLSNTLDAMWGYRTPRFLLFGRVAARMDDVLNYLPARLVALSYCLCGDAGSGWRSWRTQAAAWDSPNAGPVMAAGAGALQLQLGGAAVYHGESVTRPTLGLGAAPRAQDILRALQLVRRSLLVWLLLILLVWILSHA